MNAQSHMRDYTVYWLCESICLAMFFMLMYVCAYIPVCVCVCVCVERYGKKIIVQLF